VATTMKETEEQLLLVSRENQVLKIKVRSGLGFLKVSDEYVRLAAQVELGASWCSPVPAQRSVPEPFLWGRRRLRSALLLQTLAFQQATKFMSKSASGAASRLWAARQHSQLCW